jgi:hypothetical protein
MMSTLVAIRCLCCARGARAWAQGEWTVVGLVNTTPFSFDIMFQSNNYQCNLILALNVLTINICDGVVYKVVNVWAAVRTSISRGS